MKIRFWSLLLSAILMFAFWGCSDVDSDEGPERTAEPPTPKTFARFNPATGNPADLPVPNDILRNPMTGHLNLPLAGEPYDSANSLLGFSTSAPIVIPFGGPVAEESVNAQTILAVNLSTFQPAALTFQTVTDPSSNTHDSTVFAKPVRPLAPGTRYMVVVTPGVLSRDYHEPVQSVALMNLLKGSDPFVDAQGNSTIGSFDNQTAAALEPLRQSYQTIWAGAEQITGLERINIPMAFVFTTQPLFSRLTELRMRAQAEAPTPTISIPLPSSEAVDAFFNSAGLGAVPHNAIGAMYKGSFTAPQYIRNEFDATQNPPIVMVPMQTASDGSTVELYREDINFWAALPVGAQGPVPAIIMQHGLTRSKEDMFAIANGACSQGVAIIGIDVVLHGERTRDLLNNDTGALGPDGIPDPSGSNFLNFAIPRMARDNGIQTVADLFILNRMIITGSTDFNGDGIPELAPIPTPYVGQSLGGLIGTVFSTMEPNVPVACLNVPGGRIGSLVPNSPSISVAVNAGLASQGIMPGTAEYALFFMIFQTVVDDADPFNYAQYTLTGMGENGQPTAVLVQEMQNDLVVPNSATEDLVRSMGLPQVNAQWVYAGQQQVSAPHQGSGHYQFTDGAHGFLLDPSGGPTVQGQTQALTFLLTGLQGQPTIIDPFNPGKWAFLADLMPESYDMTLDTRFLVFMGQ